MHIAIGWAIFAVLVIACVFFILGVLFSDGAKREESYLKQEAQQSTANYFGRIGVGMKNVEQGAQKELKDAEGKVVGTLTKL